jgi:hypothetical protein
MALGAASPGAFRFGVDRRAPPRISSGWPPGRICYFAGLRCKNYFEARKIVGSFPLCRDLKEVLTRPPSPTLEHERQRVGGRVHAIVRRHLPMRA